MGTHEKAEQMFGSTTWAWRRVKIAPPPEARKHSAPKGRRWWGLPPRDPRQPLTLTVKYRGGPEAWYEIHARGSIGRVPGHVALHDLLSEINRGASQA